MSTTTTRLPLSLAREVAARLMSHLDLREPESMVVGSIRREKPDVGDLEIIAPMPDAALGDRLYQRLSNILKPAAGDTDDVPLLFPHGSPAGPQHAVIGQVIQGLKPFFRSVRFNLWLRPDKHELPEGVRSVTVELSRYTPGPVSNRGWYEIRTTGCAEFGEAFLTAWKIIRGIGRDDRGSRDNFLVDETGAQRHTPNELATFGLLAFLWVPPRLRTGPEALLAAPGTGAWAKSSPHNRRRAMEHLGIDSEEAIRVQWNEDRLAQVSGAHQ